MNASHFQRSAINCSTLSKRKRPAYDPDNSYPSKRLRKHEPATDLQSIANCQNLNVGARTVNDKHREEEDKKVAEKENQNERHNEDTRRCRARFNKKIETLTSILPSPKTEKKLNAKWRRLEYAIDCIQSLQDEISSLEHDCAFTSKRHLREWIGQIASKSPPRVDEALVSLAGLLCAKTNATTFQIWRPAQTSGSSYDGNETAPRASQMMPISSYSVIEGSKRPFVKSVDLFRPWRGSNVEKLIEDALTSLQPVTSTFWLDQYSNEFDVAACYSQPSESLAVPILMFGQVVRVVTFGTDDGGAVQLQSRCSWTSKDCPRLADFINMITRGLCNALQVKIVQHCQKNGLELKSGIEEFL